MTHKSVSELSPAQNYILSLLNSEDACNTVDKIVLARIKAICAMMNEMLTTYSVHKTLYQCEVFESESRSLSVMITREGYDTFDIRHTITCDHASRVESELAIWESNLISDSAGSLSKGTMPVKIISTLANTWGPPGGPLDNDGTYVHTLSPDFDLDLVKRIFRP